MRQLAEAAASYRQKNQSHDDILRVIETQLGASLISFELLKNEEALEDIYQNAFDAFGPIRAHPSNARAGCIGGVAQLLATCSTAPVYHGSCPFHLTRSILNSREGDSHDSGDRSWGNGWRGDREALADPGSKISRGVLHASEGRGRPAQRD